MSADQDADYEDYEDDDTDGALRVGATVIEMANRLKDVAAVLPGSEASWNFEIDDVRYKVRVSVVDKTN